MKLARIIIALVLVGCTTKPPVRPPPDGSGDCHTATETLRQIGGCGLPLDTFEADCAATMKAESDISHRLPVGCLTASKNCAEFTSCR